VVEELGAGPLEVEEEVREAMMAGHPVVRNTLYLFNFCIKAKT
jgi:hypothetical protein